MALASGLRAQLRTEGRIALAAVALLTVVAVATEAYLVQRVHTYFSGPTHNSPFGLDTAAEKAAYLGQALLFDACFYGTSVLLLLAALRRMGFAPLQRLYIAFVATVMIFAGVVLLKWELFRYFAAKFDMKILMDLAAGHLTNAAIWLDRNTLLAIALGCATPFIALIPARWLRNRSPAMLPVLLNRRKVVVLGTAWLILFVDIFVIIPFESLRFGLSNKTSYWLIEEGLQLVTDFDGDGFGPFTIPRDGDNFNAGIHPYALDLPGDGIDQNDLAGDLAGIVPSVREPAFPPLDRAKARMNVIVVVVETFRMDAAEDPVAMPFLNSLRKKHPLVPVFSNFGVTSRAIQSVLFGRIHYAPGGQSLFDEFRGAGYRTYGVSAQSEAWGGTESILRLKQLDRFHDVRNVKWDPSKLTEFQKRHGDLALFLDSKDVNQVVAEMIDAGKGPFFMYVNFQDMHYPYFNDATEKILVTEFHGESAFFRPENRDVIVRQYKNAALHLDKGLAGLFQTLEQRGLADDTVVVIVGDHPDSFFENGLTGHGWSLDRHQRLTPCLVVNGRGSWTLPMGQDEIARIVVTSVNQADQPGPARFSEDPSKRVFEMTNTLDAPRQIAWIGPSADELMTYDFKTDRWQPGTDQPWIPTRDLKPDAPSYAHFKSLVNYWESARLMRDRDARRREPDAAGTGVKPER